MDNNGIKIFPNRCVHSSEDYRETLINDAPSNLNYKPTAFEDDIQSQENESDTDTEEVLFTGTNQSLSEIENPNTDGDMFAKTEKEQQNIIAVIENVKVTNSLSTDLSRKHLQAVPEALMALSHLEYLYLEGNEICFLPDDFFKFFPCLTWLDLRNNMLSRIPSSHLSSHTCLRNLLLEGNSLCNLPLELGLVRSLHGLNIAGNPLEFPPLAIIETGTQGILQFLRNVLAAKNSAKYTETDLSLSKGDADCLEENKSESSDDWNTTASMMELAKIRDSLKHNESATQSKSNEGLQTKHKNKKKNIGDFLLIGELRKMKENKMAWKVNPFPAPPSQEYVKFKMNEEKQLARVKEFKEKTDAILQRRKDDEMLNNWRDEAKILQRNKYSQHLIPGKDYKEPAETAPYDVDKERMKVLSKEKFDQEELQRQQKLKQERSISPSSKQRIEQEKQAKIYELEKQIKQHMTNMMVRRKQPKGTVQQEMETAKRELEIIKRLQHDLKESYQKLKT